MGNVPEGPRWVAGGVRRDRGRGGGDDGGGGGRETRGGGGVGAGGVRVFVTWGW